MNVTAPPRRPGSSDPGGLADRAELEALVEALIEEARRRARRRRRRNGAYTVLAAAVALGIFLAVGRALPQGGSAAGARFQGALGGRSTVRNGPLTIFLPPGLPGGPIARIETIGGGKARPIWHCPGNVWCGVPVSFAWAPDGKHLAFSLDEVGADSGYVGLHVVNIASGQDAHVPGGAPPDGAKAPAWRSYLQKVQDRVGCFPPVELAWSPDGSGLAYRCGPDDNGNTSINVLSLNGAGHTTIPTGTSGYWPSWSPTATRIVYSTTLTPSRQSQIFTVALNGSHRRLLVTGGAAPVWSPDGKTIAYQTQCGIRLVTPSGRNVTPRANGCGAIGRSGPPVWSPDGTEIAFETKAGTYVMDATGNNLRLVSHQATTTGDGSPLPGRPSWRPLH